MILAAMCSGGYGESNEGCDCFDRDYSAPQKEDQDQSVILPTGETSEKVDMDQCLKYFEEVRRGAFEEGRAMGRLEANASPSPPASAESKSEPVVPNEREVLGTVRVKRGWWVEKYVRLKRYRRKGATLDATLLCNGWEIGENPTLQPGQRMKICK